MHSSRDSLTAIHRQGDHDCVESHAAPAPPRAPRKPINSLGQPLGPHALSSNPTHRLPATRSEAFRALQESRDIITPGQWPLDDHLTEGWYTALTMLSEQSLALISERLEEGEEGTAGRKGHDG